MEAVAGSSFVAPRLPRQSLHYGFRGNVIGLARPLHSTTNTSLEVLSPWRQSTAIAVAHVVGLLAGLTKARSARRRTAATRRSQLATGRARLAATTPGASEAAVAELPAKLAATVSALRALPSDRLRYQQLMALATQLPRMPSELKVPENKVAGCLSIVHVHATLADDGTVNFVGDSDALISKGLVALLVTGLSGCTPGEIAAVKPEFIKEAGIAATLSPGRNNGFLNMLRVMNEQALALKSSGKEP
eukprot:TRINITY_DN2902_c0_g3_i2.p1 TRINITY_DN2902_c0_g3~~TRINITY_DN2902_c0_g3_i2.p1  ORF type:complete len:247 (-),score=42.50 TRINITY_DN2902_c0_g3_i2:370-1110(-)